MNAQLNQSLISEEDLKNWLGYASRQKVEQWLSDRGIPFEMSRGQIVTTIQAINAGLIGAQQQESGFEFG